MRHLAPIEGLPNVHLLGQKKHDELPAYCKGFDVGLIPYRIDERMKFVNPLKLREYLSAGLPVVSTAVPEVQRYAHLCHIGATNDDFVAACERALGEGRRKSARAALGRWMTRPGKRASPRRCGPSSSSRPARRRPRTTISSARSR